MLAIALVLEGVEVMKDAGRSEYGGVGGR